jgi:hypothetical protein
MDSMQFRRTFKYNLINPSSGKTQFPNNLDRTGNKNCFEYGTGKAQFGKMRQFQPGLKIELVNDSDHIEVFEVNTTGKGRPIQQMTPGAT